MYYQHKSPKTISAIFQLAANNALRKLSALGDWTVERGRLRRYLGKSFCFHLFLPAGRLASWSSGPFVSSAAPEPSSVCLAASANTGKMEAVQNLRETQACCYSASAAEKRWFDRGCLRALTTTNGFYLEKVNVGLRDLISVFSVFNACSLKYLVLFPRAFSHYCFIP